MATRLDYKGIIEYYFKIKNKEGAIVPFIFNTTQNYYYDILNRDYPLMQGIRENDLKFRQPGFSSLIDGIFAVDFIWAELGKISLVDADIVSHKDKETRVLYDRYSFFIDCYLEKEGIKRKDFLESDTAGYMKGKKGSQTFVQTASARVSGRGGTKQNIHWSEVAFYSNTDVINAEDLITGAEQQVADGVGKIFRETTGNISEDYFSIEYEKGKKGLTEFKSRFFGWWVHKEYAREVPQGWEAPSYYQKLISEFGVQLSQCYWHFMKTKGLTDEKMMREYPTYDTEAFLLGGKPYFEKDALIHYTNTTRQPLKEVLYVQNI